MDAYDAGNKLYDFRRKTGLSQGKFVEKCENLAEKLGEKRSELHHNGVEVPGYPEIDLKTNEKNQYGLNNTTMSRYENGEKLPRSRQLYFIWVFRQLGVLEGISGLEKANSWMDAAGNGYLSIIECQLLLGEDIAKHYSYTLNLFYESKDVPFQDEDSQAVVWGKSSASRPRISLPSDLLVQLKQNPSLEIVVSLSTFALLLVVVASIYLYGEQIVQTLGGVTQTATPTTQIAPEVLPTIDATVTTALMPTLSPIAAASSTIQPTQEIITRQTQATPQPATTTSTPTMAVLSYPCAATVISILNVDAVPLYETASGASRETIDVNEIVQILSSPGTGRSEIEYNDRVFWIDDTNLRPSELCPKVLATSTATTTSTPTVTVSSYPCDATVISSSNVDAVPLYETASGVSRETIDVNEIVQILSSPGTGKSEIEYNDRILWIDDRNLRPSDLCPTE